MKKAKPAKVHGKSVHEIAHCRDCAWFSEARNAVAMASRHNRLTGHAVTAERGLFFDYKRKAAKGT